MIAAHPILTCQASREWEANVLGNDAEAAWAAMGRAGAAIAAQVMADYGEMRPLPANARLLVLCGTGNNGGDALIAARHILEALPEAKACVILTFGDAALKPLCARALAWLQGIGERVRVSDWGRSTAVYLSDKCFHICLDGVVGMQFQAPLRDPAPDMFEFLDAQGVQIELRAAVDLPSGVGDAGCVPGFTADFTYATGIAKAPLFTPGVRDRVGRIRYLDIGFFDDKRPAGAEEVLLPANLRPLARLRNPWTDKRSYGHVFILGGSRAMPGAVAMAALAAVRAGAGLVTAMVPQVISNRLAPLVPEAMWLPLPCNNDGFLASDDCIKIIRRNADRATAMVMGPGMDADRETRGLLARLVREYSIPLVLDASALQHEVAVAAAGRPQGTAPVVFTPHLGEFARLLGETSVDYDRKAFMEFCERFRGVTLLKGPVTRVSNGERVLCSLPGGPVLARGGSGDLLAGMIGALVARPGADVMEAVCRAVTWHGLAAEALARAQGQQAVRTTDLLDHLSTTLRSA